MVASDSTAAFKRPFALENVSIAVLPHVKSIQLQKKTLTLDIGKSYSLRPSVKPAKALQGVIYSSNKPSVATVDESGFITARSKGTAVITAKAAGGKKASLKVTAVVPMTGLSLSPATKSIKKNQSFTIKPAYAPSDAYKKALVWKSSAKSIATVDGKGKVTGKKKGTATITAATKDGSFSATCVVAVDTTPSADPADPTPPPSDPSLPPASGDGYIDLWISEGRNDDSNLGMTPGTSKQLTLLAEQYNEAYGRYYPVAPPAVTWISSNPSIVSVTKAGKITTHKAGRAAISAYKHNVRIQDGQEWVNTYSATVFVTVSSTGALIPKMPITTDDLTFTYSGNKINLLDLTVTNVPTLFPGLNHNLFTGETGSTHHSFYNFDGSSDVQIYFDFNPGGWNYINFGSSNPSTTTARGITIGSTMEEIISKYGRPRVYYTENYWDDVNNSLEFTYEQSIGNGFNSVGFQIDEKTLKVISIRVNSGGQTN